ncbi:hypothetical protein EIP86_005081 [Pleurotus ostreatoroseus]|nr:hypothetical protein EIP86_005081 [Pleurotus ostreatoroseus]
MRVAVIAANLFVLLLTWAKTFRAKREAVRFNMRIPLGTLLLRDDQADGDDTEGKTSRFSLPAFRVASSALTGNLGEELEHATFHTESAGESLGSSGVP